MRSLGLVITIAALNLTSCASAPLFPALAFDFSVPAGSDDPWFEKVRGWQDRHRSDPLAGGEVGSDASELAKDWRAFEHKLRRRIAADTVSWVQRSSREHYRPDGATDHWATLGEVIESGGDDCDGLDLLSFVLLRRLGWPESEIYRAIIVEEGTGQHHMVTLWFDQGPRSDPYVLDPTGVVTPQMVRLSQVPKWEPIELFDEARHFAVQATAPGALVAAD